MRLSSSHPRRRRLRHLAGGSRPVASAAAAVKSRTTINMPVRGAWSWMLVINMAVVLVRGEVVVTNVTHEGAMEPRMSEQITLRASDVYENTHIAENEEHQQRRRQRQRGLTHTCNYAETHFDVIYENTDDLVKSSTFSKAKAAADEAFCIWADVLAAFPHRCKVKIGFAKSAHFGDDGASTLAWTSIKLQDYPDDPITYTGCQLKQGNVPNHPKYIDDSFDIMIDFNVDFDYYYEKDTTKKRITDDQYDFIGTAAHEIGHGLGFTHAFWGHLASPDWPVWRPGVTGYQTSLTKNILVGSKYKDFSKATIAEADDSKFIDVVTGQRGSICVGDGERGCYLLYTPDPWEPGASIVHLDETRYPAGDFDSLMTPNIGSAELIRCVGPKTRKILKNVFHLALNTGYSSTCVNLRTGAHGPSPSPTRPASPTSSSTPASGTTVCKYPATKWTQCGGSGWKGRKCCTKGYKCTYVNKWYHQCRKPLSSNLTPTPKVSPSISPNAPVPSSGACLALWRQCGGRNWTGSYTCCEELSCMFKNSYFSQCEAV